MLRDNVVLKWYWAVLGSNRIVVGGLGGLFHQSLKASVVFSIVLIHRWGGAPSKEPRNL